MLNPRHIRLGGGPGEVITTDLDIVVRELAELVVVHAEQLCRLGRAQLEAGDLVDAEGEQGGDAKGPGGDGDDVRDLLVDDLEVARDEAARVEADVDAVEADDVAGAEEGVEEEAEDAREAVLRQHVHGVVDLDPELDCAVI